MNIAVLSSNSGYYQLAKKLSASDRVTSILHYGASENYYIEEKYNPYCFNLPQNGYDNADLEKILFEIKKEKVDLVLASGLAIPSNDLIHSALQQNNIPYFFVNKELTALEKAKSLSKTLLNFLEIPTGKGNTVSGEYLYKTFTTISRPFVVKLNHIFQYGRQTTVIDDNNFNEVYEDFFSYLKDGEKKVTSIDLNSSLIIEKYINIKREYSYHCLMNETNWQYFGSARDYKKSFDGDRGYNTVGMGSYNIEDIDPIVHDYADKIFRYLKSKNYHYKGFMYLGIAVDENDVPMVLEINTRSGDPELNCILDSIDNDLSEVFFLAATNGKIPEIQFNNNKIVTVRIINSKDWLEIPTDLPVIKDVPSDIFYGLESEDKFRVKHSHLTAQGVTHQEACEKIYKFLDSQYLGQFYYRKDIGIIQ